uniref:Uncharacterized protein n=1 Tax=Siphoviridae sp. ctkV91 TaxID=2827924 RepID=A0A8S5TEZ3_9CAUD|nr:MAG TPA: hypothetical protein [Siphoviridae sp. ctkV91]
MSESLQSFNSFRAPVLGSVYMLVGSSMVCVLLKCGLLVGVVGEGYGENNDGEGFRDDDGCCDHLVSRGLLVSVEAPRRVARAHAAMMARAALCGVPVAYIHVMMAPCIQARLVKNVS